MAAPEQRVTLSQAAIGLSWMGRACRPRRPRESVEVIIPLKPGGKSQ